MLRMMLRSACLVVLMLLASLVLAQTEFSADMVNTTKGESNTAGNGKMYFGKDKIRFEPAKKDARNGGAVIMNLAAHTTTVLMDQQHMYMEVPQQMASQRIGYNFFRTGDVEAACSDWAQQMHNNGGKCTKIGNDTVNGRSTVKYQGTNDKGDVSYFWIDPKLRFPVKWIDEKNGHQWELQNIQEGSQPSSLFEVPSGYQKFDMPNMGNMGGMQHPQ